jgi:AraC family transcriptional regulator of adaptative response/methylated-DNA-[protein]-cysteine methyltransferase
VPWYRFQRAVWDELRRIPPGETITYTELAVRVGRPAAVRAAAGACARNGIAIAVPCHRVLRADRTITGFRWRPDAKRRLLDLEAAAQRRRENDEERG